MLQVTEKDIAEMVRAIVDEVAPEHVILFGSRASGTCGTDSDVDFLVIDSEPFHSGRSRRRESARILKSLSQFDIPIDILLFSKDEVEEWRHSQNHVVCRALREGRIVYEK
jgi:uncharacterized protein